ncbi:endonuclease/exonuclease/phosphatase family protein [Flagellimonas olearia]|uniref:Endonuclease/exonuclease/phosphatase family protein n=1 Tax=Flagellimonas olearia TaxID=552546 RepID=A0A6I1DWN3_9FLAO|nr:endonuclease/exonuclease/phosphatase family protein [Allomuricauda olearia]KAB7528444.1 endonuclease/exonuclease/phosphatase family protein [Allomuricauda olearia]
MRSLICLLVLISTSLHGQKSNTFTLRTIAFYNVENLFDTKNDSLIFDDDRTPEGSYHWTQERYKIKIDHISNVLSKIGKETSKTSPDVIGLCEVENRQVVEDLAHHPNLVDKDYGIIHFDSPDARGIDVALLFKKESYLPTSFKSHRLLLFDELGERVYTRDQLVVGGLLNQEEVYFIVNHWPSRRGGEAISGPKRVRAALLNKRIIDSIQKLNREAKIISMGDLNDDPTDNSLKKILRTKGKPKQLDSIDLYNPMEKLYRKGIGSLAYRDKWNLFDQFFMTSNLIDTNKTKLSFWKAGIYAPAFIRTQKGKYKGYPLRTYSGGSYTGGYSDHFPSYIFLIKQSSH